MAQVLGPLHSNQGFGRDSGLLFMPSLALVVESFGELNQWVEEHSLSLSLPLFHCNSDFEIKVNLINRELELEGKLKPRQYGMQFP